MVDVWLELSNCDWIYIKDVGDFMSLIMGVAIQAKTMIWVIESHASEHKVIALKLGEKMSWPM